MIARSENVPYVVRSIYLKQLRCTAAVKLRLKELVRCGVAEKSVTKSVVRYIRDLKSTEQNYQMT